MRKLILAAGSIAVTLRMMALLSMIGLATPTNAQGGRDWCAKIRGSLRCHFATEAQCRASASGRGICVHRPSSTR